MRWPTTRETHAYMKSRQDQNAARVVANEDWMATKLPRWTRQAEWGYRLFDFWNARLGCAVEVDGPEHDPNYDQYRDEWAFRRSAIVVLRVRNRNEQDADHAILTIGKLGTWIDRKLPNEHRKALTARAGPLLLPMFIEAVLAGAAEREIISGWL